MDKREFEKLISTKGGYSVLEDSSNSIYGYLNSCLTEKQRDRCIWHATTIQNKGCYLFVKYYPYLTEEQKEICFKKAITANVYSLFTDYNYFLTKKQNKRCFLILIDMKYSYSLLRKSYHLLTPIQRQIALEESFHSGLLFFNNDLSVAFLTDEQKEGLRHYQIELGKDRLRKLNETYKKFENKKYENKLI